MAHKKQRKNRILKSFVMVSAFLLLITLIFKIIKINPGFEGDNVIASSVHALCGLPDPCPMDHLAFKISSGATDLIGPKICTDGKMIIDGMNKNGGQGINIAVVNGQTGELISTATFDMWNGEVEPLIEFLKTIKDGSFVLMASSDDPATRLNDEARTRIGELGSSYISVLGFRDNWVFVGGKGIKSMKPLEQHIRNDKALNKYDNWPEMLEMQGCIPYSKEPGLELITNTFWLK
ncbi:protein FAM3C isoform X2 [Brachyhypopomus gauderio]